MKITHRVITQIMDSFFPKLPTSKEGVCYGFSSKYADAFFSDQLDVFEKRVKKMESYFDGVEEKEASENDPQIQEGINKMQTDIKSTFEKFKRHNNVQTPIPTEQDKELIEIQGLFEGIQLQMYPDRYPDIYKKPNNQLRQNYIKNKWASEPKTLEEEGGPVGLAQIVLGFKKHELKKYLNELRELTPNKEKFGILMGGNGHEIFIGYDKGNDKWILMDVNKYPAKELNLSKLVDEVFPSLYTEENDNLVCSIDCLYKTENLGLKKGLEKLNNEYLATGANRVREKGKFVGDFPLSEAFRKGLDKNTLKKLANATETETLITMQERVNHPLIEAVRHGYDDIVEILLKKGVWVDMPDKNGISALYYAVEMGNVGMVSTLLQHGADVDVPDKDGITALLYAVKTGNVGMVLTLLQHGADFDVPDKDGITALHHAVEMGNAGIVLTLLQHGADVDVPDTDGYTPIAYAVMNGNQTLVEELVKRDFDLSRKFENKFSLIELAREYDQESTALLLEQKMQLKSKKVNGNKNLFYTTNSIQKDEETPENEEKPKLY